MSEDAGFRDRWATRLPIPSVCQRSMVAEERLELSRAKALVSKTSVSPKFHHSAILAEEARLERACPKAAE